MVLEPRHVTQGRCLNKNGSEKVLEEGSAFD